MIKSKNIIESINKVIEAEVSAPTIGNSTPEDIITYLTHYLKNIKLDPTNDRLREFLNNLLRSATSKSIKSSLRKALDLVK